MYVTLFSLVACGAATPPAVGSGANANATAAPETFAQQVALGTDVYVAHCAKCHGDSGQGIATKAPRVVGLAAGALPIDSTWPMTKRTAKFITVADVAGFAVANMPGDARGTLAEEQYWAVLAFDLKANGITLQQKLDGKVAATLTIPR